MPRGRTSTKKAAATPKPTNTDRRGSSGGINLDALGGIMSPGAQLAANTLMSLPDAGPSGSGGGGAGMGSEAEEDSQADDNMLDGDGGTSGSSGMKKRQTPTYNLATRLAIYTTSKCRVWTQGAVWAEVPKHASLLTPLLQLNSQLIDRSPLVPSHHHHDLPAQRLPVGRQLRPLPATGVREKAGQGGGGGDGARAGPHPPPRQRLGRVRTHLRGCCTVLIGTIVHELSSIFAHMHQPHAHIGNPWTRSWTRRSGSGSPSCEEDDEGEDGSELEDGGNNSVMTGSTGASRGVNKTSALQWEQQETQARVMAQVEEDKKRTQKEDPTNEIVSLFKKQAGGGTKALDRLLITKEEENKQVLKQADLEAGMEIHRYMLEHNLNADDLHHFMKKQWDELNAARDK